MPAAGSSGLDPRLDKWERFIGYENRWFNEIIWQKLFA